MKRTPLKRKESLRDSYARRLKEKGTTYSWNRSGDISRRKPMKKVSKSQRNKLKEYYALQKEFLSRPKNQKCAVCVVLYAARETSWINVATEVHHIRGRCGRLLTWEPGWAGTCRTHREWPHVNPARARELGLLAEARDWNVFPNGG